jgi:hypothetical protein
MRGVCRAASGNDLHGLCGVLGGFCVRRLLAVLRWPCVGGDWHRMLACGALVAGLYAGGVGVSGDPQNRCCSDSKGVLT